jgi:nickel/cobalt transporter (NiCoT) family protein
MMLASAFTVYALGLRHGADPDHLAAIDAMTRNAAVRSPRTSRFVGALFAGGHTVMVIAIAALVGLLGTRLAAHGSLIELVGTWISIAVLLLLAVLNVRQLMRGETDRVAGARLRLLPKALRESGNPWLAAVVGLLFGFGFETSSQIGAYAAAFSARSGVWGAVVVGAMFCLGMITTDLLDSALVQRLVTYRSERLPAVMRLWIVCVTICALAVAGYEIGQVTGAIPAGSELVMSAALAAALLVVFLCVYYSTTGATRLMNILRNAGVLASVFGLAFAISLYSFGAARGSNHQDSPTVVENPLASITDVFAFPDPRNAGNIVLDMDVDPLIPAGFYGDQALDPNVLYQLKIANGVPSNDYKESLVLQFLADSSGPSQRVTLYGPAKPNEIGTKNTLVAATGTVPFNKPTVLDGGKIQVFVGPRRDPFFFDLAQFFKIVPDRNYQNHPHVPPATATSFNFPSKNTKILDITGKSYGTAGKLGCDIATPSDLLYDFDVLSIVVEMPKSMLVPSGGTPGVIGLWATASTPSGNVN